MIDYDLVNSFIGKKWIYLENDCWAVIKQASKQIFGVEIVDNISFSDKPAKGETALIVNEQTKLPCWMKTDNPKGGDVVVFNDRKNNPVHVGIFIEAKNVLHCMGGHSVKNGKTRYDSINTIKLIYPICETYTYVDNGSPRPS